MASTSPGSASAAFDEERIRAQLRKWQERLLDLTKANPLLGINRSRVSKLRVTDPKADALFDLFVADETTLRMPLVRKEPKRVVAAGDPENQPSEPEYKIESGDLVFDVKPIDLLRRLRRIYDNARTTVEERGVTTLYLTFGVLTWEDAAIGESVAPLWMVPCQLESLGPSAALRLSRADEEMQLNPALELYLRERQRVTLPPIPEEPKAGDLPAFLEAVRAAVREQGWTVEDHVWLSTYTFESLVIYQDLKAMADVALGNAIVGALARAVTPPEGSEALGEEPLDALPTPEKIPVPVLPTDSSQLKGLALVAAGRNLVIHGPPGTGKSQTISNLIADSIGQGKQVLFVSAKMAALNVVYDRLAQLGLGRFCLEAHSTKAGKARIIEQLKRTLEATRGGDGELLGEQLEELIRLRNQLNEYVRELHRRREPLGRTIYQAIGKVERLRDAPDLRAPLPWEDPLVVTRSDLGSVLEALQDLAAQAPVFDGRTSHPWRGLAIQPGVAVRQEEIEADLATIRNSVRQLYEELTALAELLGQSVASLPLSLVSALSPSLAALADAERLPSGWATRSVEELAGAARLFESAAAHATELASKKAEYKKVLDLPFGQAKHLLAPAEEQFNGWTRAFRPSYWRWRSSVRRQLLAGAPTGFRSVLSYLAMARRLAVLENWFEGHRAALNEEVDANGLHDPETLTRTASAFRVAALLRTAITTNGLEGPLGSPVLTTEMRQRARAAASLARDADLAHAVGKMNAAWPEGFVDCVMIAAASLPAVMARCEEVLAALPRIHEWVVLQHTLRKCRELGLGKFIDALGTISARAVPGAFERRFYAAWANAAIERSPSVAVFAGVRREEQIERFRVLDAKIRECGLGRIMAFASGPARRISSAQSNLGHAGEVGILRRELEKRRRIKPLRKLFAEIPHALQALKPCMLMSPLSVSTFLKPGTISFDLVVFDEASQLPTQEAIPAILRAKQVVVAGDANQLPPTSFFAASLIFEEDGEDEKMSEELEPLESLLDDCVAIFPVFDRAHLRWHYRSKDERLIKFSNHYFYDNTLITFPSVSTSKQDRGVRLEYVADGIWDRGRSRTNRREARRGAELIVEQLERHPERSIGVVAMNVTQREAIEDALNELILERPDLPALLDPGKPEPFFIKALENVQGDERDTMIISIGYGRTVEGTLGLNFGPLNQEGGWRRLNVLVTRAKWHTILVTSMRSQELGGVNPNNRGAIALRNFIAYAERGGELPAAPPVLTPGETNDFEDAVAEALRERGFEVDQQVGASDYRIDLAIRDARDRNRYVLGVECDGATYHSARTARDRDLLRQQVLREHGWRLHRLWSTDWFRNREAAIAAVLHSLEKALQAPIEESPLAPPRPSATAPTTPIKSAEPTGANQSMEGTSAPSSRRFATGEPYRKYREASSWHGRDYLLSRRRVHALAEQVAAIVQFEGPIYDQLLTERLKEIHGIARTGGNVQANVDRAIVIAVRAHGLERNGDFLKCRGTDPHTFRVPGDGVHRSLGQVPPKEIELAILYVVEDQFGFPRDALPHAVAGIFGSERAGAGSAEIIGGVVDDLVERGQLRVSGLHLYIS